MSINQASHLTASSCATKDSSAKSDASGERAPLPSALDFPHPKCDFFYRATKARAKAFRRGVDVVVFSRRSAAAEGRNDGDPI